MRRATISDLSGKVLSVIDIADTRSDRRRGLLGQTSIEVPMWFPKTRSVHTVGMLTSIDVAHVDKEGTILRVRTMRPGRVGWPRVRAAAILETAPGQCATLGLVPGQRVVLS